MIDKEKKIYIAGHRGMVGTAVWRKLSEAGYRNIAGSSSEDLDLRQQGDVRDFMASEKPEVVVIAAKKVEGILDNDQHPYTILYENLIMQSNLIDAARVNRVKQLIFIANSSVYPADCPQPMKEECLFNGTLDTTNQWYAYSKVTGLKLCEAIRRQYRCNYISLIPSNLYGPYDRFRHAFRFIPSLIRKFHQAREEGHVPVTMWGTGRCRREFLYVGDLADAVLFFLENETRKAIYNVGTGKDMPIGDLAAMIQEITGHEGEVHWEMIKPDATRRKWMDVSRLTEEGWRYSTEMIDGLRKTYKWFLDLPQELQEA